MIRRPRAGDLPAFVSGLALLLWAVSTAGGGRVVLGLGILLGILAAGLTVVRWPGTVAASLAVGAEVTATPSLQGALIAGLLVTAYLVLLEGIPPLVSLWPIAGGVLLAVVVVLVAVTFAPAASFGWVLAAGAAAPLLLWFASTGAHHQQRGR